MTGVTILTKSRFKLRHAGLKDIVQRPDTGFIIKQDEPVTRIKLLSRKKATKKAANEFVRVMAEKKVRIQDQ